MFHSCSIDFFYVMGKQLPLMRRSIGTSVLFHQLFCHCLWQRECSIPLPKACRSIQRVCLDGLCYFLVLRFLSAILFDECRPLINFMKWHVLQDGELYLCPYLHVFVWMQGGFLASSHSFIINSDIPIYSCSMTGNVTFASSMARSR